MFRGLFFFFSFPLLFTLSEPLIGFSRSWRLSHVFFVSSVVSWHRFRPPFPALPAGDLHRRLANGTRKNTETPASYIPEYLGTFPDLSSHLGH